MMDLLVTTNVNWSVNNQKSIEDAVKVTRALVGNSDDIEETVSIESCIHLQAPNPTDVKNDEKCTLKLECCKPETTGLSQLVVVSEAKKLEIYTDHGEYLQTVSTDFIDKIDEDFIVYKGIFDFEKPVSSCVIKFASLRKPNEIWVYGVRIAVVDVDKPPSLSMKKPVFDMDKVLERIQGSDHQLSGKAQNFAQFLAMCKKPEIEAGPNYSEILGLCSTFLRPPSNPQTTRDNAVNTPNLPGDLLQKHLDHLRKGVPQVAPGLAGLGPPRCLDETTSSGELLQKYLDHLRKGTPHSSFGVDSLLPPRSSDDAGGSGEGNVDLKLKTGAAAVPGTGFLEPLRKSILRDVDELFSRHMRELEERLWSKLSVKFLEMEDKQERQMKKLQDTLEACLQNQSADNNG